MAPTRLRGRRLLSLDRCDLGFDLRPVAGLHQQMYGRKDPIQLNVHGYFEGEPGEAISLTWTAE